MDFLQKTTDWVKGEIIDATIFGSIGLLAIVFSLLCWKFGETPNSKAVVIPFAVVGLFLFVTAISGIVNNNKRLKEYQVAFQTDRDSFVVSEKKRVEDFQYLYKITLGVAAVSFAIAIGIFLLTNNAVLKAIGLALIVFGLTGLMIDYFSKKRADIYYKAITTEMQKQSK